MQIEIKEIDLSKILGEKIAKILISEMNQVVKEHVENIKQKEYLNINEACEYIGISFNTIKKFIELGLPIIMIDGIKRIKKSDIDKFLEKYKI